MNAEQRRRCRRLIESEGWHRIGIVDEDPPYYSSGKSVYVLYEDEDRLPCIIDARYEKGINFKQYVALSGREKGNVIAKPIAWKEMEL